jgi:hypothetical protein
MTATGRPPAVYSASAGADRPAADHQMSDPYRNRLQARIEELASEHRDIERLLEQLLAEPVADQLRIRRMKKRKLLMKDQIMLMRRELDPDLPA